LPATEEIGTASKRAVVKDAREYLGGRVARSALEDGALLARLGHSLRDLLGLWLERIAEARLGGDDEATYLLTEGLKRNLEQIVGAVLTRVRAAAREEILTQLALLFQDFSPADIEREDVEEGDGLERVERLLSRFAADLSAQIARRFWLAELLGESAEAAAASLTKDTLLGRAVSRRFEARLSTILTSEWTLAANLTRCEVLTQVSEGEPGLLVKYLYFDRAPCDGSCIAWATGGIGGQGIYPADQAPMPVADTHPNCRCVLTAWREGAEFVGEPDAPYGEKPTLSNSPKRLLQRAAQATRAKRSRQQILRAHRLGRSGERRLGKWLEERGRRIVTDPRKKPLTGHGPDATTIRTVGGKRVAEFWDNKAYRKSRTVSSSSALENLQKPTAQAEGLRKAVEKSNLSEAEKEKLLGEIEEKTICYRRVVSNAGGKARPGPSLGEKGIDFQKMGD